MDVVFVTLELYEVVSVRVVVKCEDIDGSDIEDDSYVVLCNARWGGSGFCRWFVVCYRGVRGDWGNGLGVSHRLDKWHEWVIVVLGLMGYSVDERPCMCKCSSERLERKPVVVWWFHER